MKERQQGVGGEHFCGVNVARRRATKMNGQCVFAAFCIPIEVTVIVDSDDSCGVDTDQCGGDQRQRR